MPYWIILELFIKMSVEIGNNKSKSETLLGLAFIGAGGLVRCSGIRTRWPDSICIFALAGDGQKLR